MGVWCTAVVGKKRSWNCKAIYMYPRVLPGSENQGERGGMVPLLFLMFCRLSLRLLGSGLFQYQENKQHHGFEAAMFTSSTSHTAAAVLWAFSLAALTQGKEFPFPVPTPADQQPPVLVAWSPKPTEAPRIRGRVPLPAVFARQTSLPPSWCGYANADESASPSPPKKTSIRGCGVRKEEKSSRE